MRNEKGSRKPHMASEKIGPFLLVKIHQNWWSQYITQETNNGIQVENFGSNF